MKNPLRIITLSTLFFLSQSAYPSESPESESEQRVEVPLADFLQAFVGGQPEEEASESNEQEDLEPGKEISPLEVELLSYDKEDISVSFWGPPPSSIEAIQKFMYFIKNSENFFNHFAEPETIPLLIVGPENSGKNRLVHQLAKDQEIPLRQIDCLKVANLRAKLIATLNDLAKELADETPKSLFLLKNFPLKFDLHEVFKKLDDPTLCEKIFLVSTSSSLSEKEEEQEAQDLNMKRLDSTGKAIIFRNPEPSLEVKTKIIRDLLATNKIELSETEISEVIQSWPQKKHECLNQNLIEQIVHGTTVKYFLDQDEGKTPLTHFENTFNNLKRYTFQKRKRDQEPESHLRMYL